MAELSGGCDHGGAGTVEVEAEKAGGDEGGEGAAVGLEVGDGFAAQGSDLRIRGFGGRVGGGAGSVAPDGPVLAATGRRSGCGTVAARDG